MTQDTQYGWLVNTLNTVRVTSRPAVAATSCDHNKSSPKHTLCQHDSVSQPLQILIMSPLPYAMLAYVSSMLLIYACFKTQRIIEIPDVASVPHGSTSLTMSCCFTWLRISKSLWADAASVSLLIDVPANSCTWNCALCACKLLQPWYSICR